METLPMTEKLELALLLGWAALTLPFQFLKEELEWRHGR